MFRWQGERYQLDAAFRMGDPAILVVHAHRSGIASRLLVLCARDLDNLTYDVRITPWRLAGCALMAAGAVLPHDGAAHHLELVTHAQEGPHERRFVLHRPSHNTQRDDRRRRHVVLFPESCYRGCVGWDTDMSKVLREYSLMCNLVFVGTRVIFHMHNQTSINTLHEYSSGLRSALARLIAPHRQPSNSTRHLSIHTFLCVVIGIHPVHELHLL